MMYIYYIISISVYNKYMDKRDGNYIIDIHHIKNRDGNYRE